jgi:methionine synthase II (cobalamin-independent)
MPIPTTVVGSYPQPDWRLIAAPDCGMKYLTRAVAFAKLRALVDGARG